MTEPKVAKKDKPSKAERRKAEADATLAELELAKAQRAEAEELAADRASGTFYFNSSIGGGGGGLFSDPVSVGGCRSWLNKRVRLHPGQPVEIVINSPGGSVFDGLDLGDAIQATSDAGCHVTITVAGMAASMAGVVLQFADTRIIGRNSWLHLHEVSTGAIGKASDLKDTAELAKRLTMQACDIYARKSTLTADEIFTLMERQEIWLSPQEAIDYGFADEIR